MTKLHSYSVERKGGQPNEIFFLLVAFSLCSYKLNFIIINFCSNDCLYTVLKIKTTPTIYSVDVLTFKIVSFQIFVH